MFVVMERTFGYDEQWDCVVARFDTEAEAEEFVNTWHSSFLWVDAEEAA